MQDTNSSLSKRLREFLAFLLLFAMGVLVFFLVVVLPARKVSEAKGWTKTPCRIVSSEVDRVRKQSSSGSREFYSPKIAYTYEFEGKTYSNSRYSFSATGSTSPRKSYRIVDDYPEGSQQVCYVNPASPSEAVLMRGHRAVTLFGLLGIPLALFGLGGMASSLFRRRQRPAPEAGAWVTLQPKQTRLKNFLVGCVILAVLACVTVIAGSEAVFFITAVCLILTVVVFVGVLHSFLSLFNPRIEAKVSTLTVPPGASFKIAWQLQGKADRIKRLSLTLEGTEEKHEVRNGKKRVDREVFETIQIAETDVPADMVRGEVECWVPEEARLSTTEGEVKVIWRLCFRGEIAMWPDVAEAHEVSVVAPE